VWPLLASGPTACPKDGPDCAPAKEMLLLPPQTEGAVLTASPGPVAQAFTPWGLTLLGCLPRTGILQAVVASQPFDVGVVQLHQLTQVK
jgi:hypothetical protein